MQIEDAGIIRGKRFSQTPREKSGDHTKKADAMNSAGSFLLFR
jgi:hypothetical protein